MRIAFFLGKQLDLDHNTGLRVLEQLDDDKPMSDLIKEIGYPLVMEIKVAKQSEPAPEERIILVAATDGGPETVKQFYQLVLSYGAKYHGMSWGEEPDNFILRRLGILQNEFPQIRVTTRQWYIHTVDINKDVLDMVMNFDNM